MARLVSGELRFVSLAMADAEKATRLLYQASMPDEIRVPVTLIIRGLRVEQQGTYSGPNDSYHTDMTFTAESIEIKEIP